jgi:hypothetical protein
MHASVIFGRRTYVSLAVGVYCFLGTASFGAALIDGVYAGAIRSTIQAADAERLFQPIADLLLQLLAVTFLAALVAIGSSWPAAVARNLLIASVAIMATQLVAPALLESLPPGSAAGFWLRLVLSGSAAVLALAALRALRPSAAMRAGAVSARDPGEQR